MKKGKIKMEELISVIMSVYNETESDLSQSIQSILKQTYKNIEFIIVDDNPENNRIKEILLQQTDPRIKIIYNKKNMGLVYSLNEALKHANGKFIARMDADDVSVKNRIENEYKYLTKQKLDLVGTWIELIDDQNKNIGKIKFPTTTTGIIKQIRFGGCMAHPTWFGKYEVFSSLNGYREISYCEDYDFLLRAINKGYKLANVPYYGLNYRIRKNGISLSNKNKQIVIMRFLAHNRMNIDLVTEKILEEYKESLKYKNELLQLREYEMSKEGLYNHQFGAIIQVLKNKNLYKYLYEKFISAIYRKLYVGKGYDGC